jgi:hypothetical protein
MSHTKHLSFVDKSKIVHNIQKTLFEKGESFLIDNERAEE